MKRYTLLFVYVTISVLLSAREPIKVACVGNSITYGLYLNNRDHDSYPSQLQRLLGDKYLVANFGKSGTTLLSKGHHPYVKEPEYQEAKQFAGDIIVIHLGINDTDPRNWPNYRDDFIKDYLQLIKDLIGTKSNARVIIARLSPISSRHKRFISGTRDWQGQIQQQIENVVKMSGAEMIDFHEPLYYYPNFFPDGLHPNAEGAEILAKTVYSAITGDYGGLQISSVFTDNMVLQRNQAIKISGIANADEEVTVSINHMKSKGRAGKDGRWTVYFNALQAGGPYELTFSAKSRKLSFKNVMVGEVWLCSGQSNMEFMMWQAATGEKDIPKANDKGLRLFDMKGRWRPSYTEWGKDILDSLNHLNYYQTAHWKEATPESVHDFSAIAYYFGKSLRDSLKVPVGLICNAVGGSPTEAWVDRNTLEYYFPAILNDWTHNDFVQDWVRERALYNTKQSEDPLQRHPYEPCYLFETGIQPLGNYPIKGVLWYQGESNAHNWEAHEQLFTLLVKGWRRYWGKESLPFYFVQLSSINRPSWTWFRDSQRRLADKLPFVEMVVSSDIGDSTNIHPTRKQEIGERLLRQVLFHEYNHQIIPSGPVVKNAVFGKGSVKIDFKYGQGLHAANGNRVVGFEIAEVEGLYSSAEVEIHDGYLILRNRNVPKPHYVRYGWRPYTEANLVNGENLPASTFRISDQE